MEENEFVVTLSRLAERKKLATILRSAASGNRIALDALEQKDQYLHAFLHHYLDSEQRKILSVDTISEIEPQLDGMRELGREAEIFLDNEAKIRATEAQEIQDYYDRVRGVGARDEWGNSDKSIPLNFDEDQDGNDADSGYAIPAYF